MNNPKIKISTESYKGVRDFFPTDMFVQNHIFNTWKKTAEKYGYLQYDASVLESSDLYKAKSGEEIVNEQTYTFTDRGDREVTLRPEMTPTLARMIAAKRRELPTPIRWFSMPNLFRYEAPQRGRLREHWQFNVDIFGVKTIDAETEVLSLASDMLKSFGLKDSDFEIRINSRKVIDFILNEMYALNTESAHRVAKLIDRKNKMSAEQFEQNINEIIPEAGSSFLTLLNSKNFEEFVSQISRGEEIDGAIKEIKDLMNNLEKLGITNVIFDQTIMRGFDYYTGIVFEINDKHPDNRRAIMGGGRYDDLLSIFGSEKIPAVGMGVGDVGIRNILETYGLLPKYTPPTKLYICLAEESAKGYAQDLAQKLRSADISVAVDYSGKKVGEQIKYADKSLMPFITVLGEEEVKTGNLKIKELANSTETVLTEDSLINFFKNL
ncbi:MAG: histidine--tRNA ligase [bacterium]